MTQIENKPFSKKTKAILLQALKRGNFSNDDIAYLSKEYGVYGRTIKIIDKTGTL